MRARQAHRQENFWSSCAALIVSSWIWSSSFSALSLILSVTPTSLAGMVGLVGDSVVSLDGVALPLVCRAGMCDPPSSLFSDLDAGASVVLRCAVALAVRERPELRLIGPIDQVCILV